MENKRSEFKKLLEKTVIPEVVPYEERDLSLTSLLPALCTAHPDEAGIKDVLL